MNKNMHASKSVSRMWFSLVVIISALSCAVWAAVSDSTPRVLMPQLAGIVACAGALLVWIFFELNRRILRFFLMLAVLYSSVPLIRLCIGSALRPVEFLVSLESAAAAFVPIMFFWFLAGQTKKSWIRKLSCAFVYVLTMALVVFPGSLWAYFIAMKQLLTSDIILALAQTNSDESKEYFQAHADFKWALAALFTLALAVFFVWLLRKSGVGTCRRFKGRFECGIMLFVLSLYELFNVLPSVPYLATSVLKVTGTQLKQYEHYAKRSGDRATRLAKIGGITCKKGHAGIYLLVIGESANRDHMQLYGYARENTPFMSSLKQDGNTFYFDKAYSSFPQTVPALTYALTGKNQYNGADLLDSFSLIEIARKAGFEIYWLSNQRKIGVYETPISVIASAADHEIWLNNTAKMYSLFLDGELVDRFPDLADKDNALIVVHLMGSHERYAERTPDKFKVYSGAKDPRTDEYDASILYTDENLRRLYQKVSAHPRFQAMVYFSDHGEDLDTLFDHNPAQFTFPMVRIPLMIKVSDAYALVNKDVTQSLRAHRKSLWTNDLLFDLMCGMMGIAGMPQYRAAFDLSSPSYRLNGELGTTMHGKVKVMSDPHFNH